MVFAVAKACFRVTGFQIGAYLGRLCSNFRQLSLAPVAHMINQTLFLSLRSPYHSLLPLSCMRHAPRTVAREELQFECGEHSAVVHHAAYRTHALTRGISSSLSRSRCRFASIKCRCGTSLLITLIWWSPLSAPGTAACVACIRKS